MARIEEYLPQVQAQGPSNVPPDYLAYRGVQQVGQGIQQFGADVSRADDVVYNRQEQDEASTAMADFAQARADWTNKLQTQMANGTLNVDQFKQQYQDSMDQMSDKYQTNLGRTVFQRQSARLGGSLLVSAMKGQAVIAGNKAVSDWQTAVNSNSDALMQNPAQFHDAYESMVEGIQGQVKAGAINQEQATKMIKASGAELSKGAIRGWANMNPQAAQHMLDQGAFDQFLDSDSKFRMQQEVRAYGEAQATDVLRQKKIADAAQAEASQNWSKTALPQLVNNQLTPKAVLQSPMKWEDQVKWLNMIKAQSKAGAMTDPSLKNQLTERMLLPDNDPRKISDPSQLWGYVGKGLTPQDVVGMGNWFRQTPEGQSLTNSRKMLLNTAKAAIANTGGLLGGHNAQGEYNLLQFTAALQNKEEAYRKEGKAISSLYDPTSADFFGKMIPHYQLSPQQMISGQADQMKFNPTPIDGQMSAPAPVQQTPGAPIQNQTAPPKEGDTHVFSGFTYKRIGNRWVKQ